MIELYVLRTAAIAVGEHCQFLDDNPIQDLESEETIQTQVMNHNLVHVYTDNFGDCHGCVRSIKFCYRHLGVVRIKT